MKYFVLKKFKYIRGYEHDMPANEMCKNGFTDLKEAFKAKKALEDLNTSGDISYVIVCQVDPELKITMLKEYKKAFEEYVDA
tara:strand:+ start:234 stop:479 length:246 start_codon:yes stop_codon:yes gene_type:complete